jgi:hypothetical protein
VSDTTYDLGANAQVPITVLASDAAGSPVTGVTPVVTSSDETVVTIGSAADGTTLAVRATQSSGTATVTATFTKSDGSTVAGTLSLTLAPAGGTGGGSGVDAITNVEIVPGIPS